MGQFNTGNGGGGMLRALLLINTFGSPFSSYVYVQVSQIFKLDSDTFCLFSVLVVVIESGYS